MHLHSFIINKHIYIYIYIYAQTSEDTREGYSKR